MCRLRVIWHRRDLRLADNVLYDVDPSTSVVPVYIFDPKDFAPQRSCSDASHSVARMGPFAARFLVESVHALRSSLKSLGVDLLVRSGEPRNVIPTLLAEVISFEQYDQIEVVWHDEAGVYEAAEATAVLAAVHALSRQKQGLSIITTASFFGCTMWHPLQLAGVVYSPTQAALPSQEVDISPKAWEHIKQQGVQSFRRKARVCVLRPPLGSPTCLSSLPAPGVPTGDVPILTDLMPSQELFGLTKAEVQQIVAVAQGQFNAKSAHPLCGGEKAGLQHLERFVSGPVAYCNRDGGGDADGRLECSAKVSAYLAFGCLSPRTIYAMCKSRSDGKAMWLPENLEMRDFWIFYALAHGRDLFKRDGDSATNLPPSHWKSHNPDIWRRWLLGTTGLPLLDAAMKELLATGYTSNRCRQIPVSVLSNDLALDWRSGAELYQWLLVDHDLGPNWGNWRYFAGVGCDPKQRHYKALSQGLRYDADATFVKTWLPQLRDLSPKEAHLIPIRRARSLKGDMIQWPAAVVDASKQLSWDDKKNLGYEAELRSDEHSRQVGIPNGHGKGKGKATGKSAGADRRQWQDVPCRIEANTCSAPAVRRWHAKKSA